MVRATALTMGVVLVLAAVAAAPARAADAGATGHEVPHVAGPRRIDLGDGVELDLPAGAVLYERTAARALLEAAGNHSEGVLGVVMRTDRRWVLVIEHEPIGYVSDADAGELEPESLLASFREGTAQQNARRRELGLAELVIDGWSEPPRYDRAKHQLLWSIRGHTAQGPGINSFTRVLGRGGYLSLSLVDEPETIEQSKQEAAAIIDATRFLPGAQYEDYREGDKSSGMGLRMLVLGGAGVAVAKAAKTGILVAILLALKKFFVVIGLGVASLCKWLLHRRSRPPAAPVTAADPDAGAGPYVV
ncbi:MAG TPA: DUF2167 domain-containing protein [Kofleriaceae bacterium]|nr:DUF2167 domain-containing protein [Kofleriaceae bacterium]